MNITGDFSEKDLWSPEAEKIMYMACELACIQEEIPPERVEVSVTFASEEEIKDLNRNYRGIDKPTDVLSFPQFEPDEEIPEDGPVFLGDVVICPERCRKQACEYGHSNAREFTYLFIHSILHLLGYDHMDEDERKEMRLREEEIVKIVLGKDEIKINPGNHTKHST